MNLLAAVKKWLRGVSPGAGGDGCRPGCELGHARVAAKSRIRLAVGQRARVLARQQTNSRSESTADDFVRSASVGTFRTFITRPCSRTPPTSRVRVVLGRDSRPDIFNILPEVFIGPSVAFSADGKVLLSAGFDGTLNFWDTASRQRLFSQTSDQLHFRTLASLAQGDRTRPLSANLFQWAVFATARKSKRSESA